MKKLLSIILSIGILFQPATIPITRADELEPASGAVVCLPDAYLTAPDNCLPTGPSAYLTEMAKLGLIFPPRPLSNYKPDPELTKLPYQYFHLDKDFVPVLSEPAGIESGKPFPPGFVYISYIDRVEIGKKVYYKLESGSWIPGRGARVSAISAYQGFQFQTTPTNAFGWPFEYIPIKKAPGYNSPETGNYLNPFVDIIQVYDTNNTEGADWNMIGLNQWVEARKVAIVYPNPTPPEGVTTGRWIDVDLAEQTLAVYDNYQLVFATVIASGLEPFYTKPGLFQIYLKKETETMRNNDPTDYYYLDNVPWTMYFDKARALHGAYWRTRFGYPQSHGCVNLSVGDSHWLFNWAVAGDWVYIHDPSGVTPTDPALYFDWAY